MNWDQIEGNWKQAKGKVKEQCGKLTDDDIATINGKRDQLAGKVQERYGKCQGRSRTPGQRLGAFRPGPLVPRRGRRL
jgi:uncharacterized protein YjbJ (UPF0337 family)